MISICIPVYNFDVTQLVNGLNRQVAGIGVPVEIVLIDDASSPQFREINRAVTGITRYIQLEENIGRARIRNLFLQHTHHPWLLFLDCDGSVDSNPGFLQNYLDAIHDETQVICGGRIYPPGLPSGKQTLSWKYGQSTESKPAVQRNRHPHRSFMTNNFLLRKELLASTPFEEKIRQYGHEDTLFGIRLQQRSISVIHIDNPVLNLHIEENTAFLEKNGQAIANLVLLISIGKLLPADHSKVRVLKAYTRLERYGLAKPFGIFYRRLKGRIRQNLQSTHPSLWLFSLYKLGCFHEAHTALLQKEQTKKVS